MTRRWLTLCMVVCLLVGALAAFPASPTLVCRVTGQPMPPAAATEARKTCCAVAAVITPDGGTRYRLVTPGCCDLRQAAEQTELPFVFAVAPASVSDNWAPAPPVLFIPPAAESVSYARVIDPSAPRAPPLHSSTPRAPPVCS